MDVTSNVFRAPTTTDKRFDCTNIHMARVLKPKRLRAEMVFFFFLETRAHCDRIECFIELSRLKISNFRRQANSFNLRYAYEAQR